MTPTIDELIAILTTAKDRRDLIQYQSRDSMGWKAISIDPNNGFIWCLCNLIASGYRIRIKPKRTEREEMEEEINKSINSLKELIKKYANPL